MQVLLEPIFIVIYILHLPALAIARLGSLLANKIFITWAIYLFIFWAVISKKSLPLRKRRLFAILFLAYILMMIILVEKVIASGLNLTRPILIYVPMK